MEVEPVQKSQQMLASSEEARQAAGPWKLIDAFLDSVDLLKLLASWAPCLGQVYGVAET